MRITRRHLAAVGALALVAAAPVVHAETADETAVKEAINDLLKAMVSADKAKLDSLLSDQLSYGHSSGKIETKAIVLDVVGGKKTIYKSINLVDPTVAVVGNNAIARHIGTFETEADGKPGSSRVGVMQVWVKDGGRWKLLARQAYRLA
jgi:ketosteroid isomerase-like protein